MSDLSHALHQERAYHDLCRTALAAMVDSAAHHVLDGEHAFASGADAEVLGRHLRSRAKELDEEPERPLFFGRLDFAPDGEGDGEFGGSGRRHYIGRRRINRGPATPPLVIDWRAPVARAFYQADARDPQGVTVRRRFGWAPFSTGASAELTGLEDECLTRPGAGPSAIVADEIERPRTGPMRDIAATIQPEQDDLVRSDLADSLCVQGAPGTGKTAVGLHRAAYLLYTHPRRVERGGLLIIGPNRAFLAYISEVLPSLGETGVRQSTVEDEIARHPVRLRDTPAAELVKHDARMAGVLRRALYARVAPPPGTLTVPDGSYRWRVPQDELARIVAETLTEGLPYAVGRERVRSRVVRAVQLLAERRAGPKGDTWVRRMERARPVTALLDAVWPRACPEEALAAFLADPSDDALHPAEQAALRRTEPPRSHRNARWSAADLLLLDELAGLLERPDGFSHVVIDEAQDLSPMECRAIARRSVFGSLTVLGDLAQGTTPWAARHWPEQLAHLGRADTPVIPLTTGFRSPSAVVDLANRLLPALDVDVPPARSLRTGGEVAIRRVDDLATATVESVRSAAAQQGSIGVIAPEAYVPRLLTALSEAGIPAVPLSDLSDGLSEEGRSADPSDARVTVLPATLAKGLEYDHVIAVEPAAITTAEPRGLHRLYVVLTRAVTRLDVLHLLPLPPELACSEL